jgi:DNA-binding CsgD family transcriptional regulator
VTAAIQEQIDTHLQALADLFRRLDSRRPTGRRLSDRELQVAMLASATPLTSRQIGARLFVSEETVKTTLGRAYRKLGIVRRVELAHALRRLGDGS